MTDESRTVHLLSLLHMLLTYNTVSYLIGPILTELEGTLGIDRTSK